ncbi:MULTISPECIES: L-lactate permease [unclassified Pseudonocardia]|uniref:L-lactate permease n=1 Tax=unclassified Pseudonocardia TaxID=2619320 RepID=UPI0002DAF9F4|nr:L-lactate permease [Pseudonocardia sp. Ae707_Ps1]OLM18000.1 L-lactate permease [Pseudonocardia sp. Ae707_Ps1]
MFQQQLAPLGSLTLSALVALLPLLTIFVLLGALRWKAHWAALAALAVSIVVAVVAFGMPAHLALLSATEGAVFGLFPIMWIVFTAIWLYQVTVASGRFEDLRAAFHLISDDPRVQAVIIAFCFGGLLEALAGFGAPVAITGVMLMALGFSPIRAAVVVLVANTAPVAFGAVGTPIITAGTLTGIPYAEIGAVVGHQTPVLAFVVPLLLVFLVDGVRGMRQTWPVALVIGLAFAVAQWLAATYLSVELTDIVAALTGLVAGVVMLRFWQPSGGTEAMEKLRGERADETPSDAPDGGGGTALVTEQRALTDRAEALTTSRTLMAFFPYLLVIVVFSIAKLWTPAKSLLSASDVGVAWPGLDGQVLDATGEAVSTTTYNFQWLSSPGSLLLLSGIVVAVVYRVSPGAAWREFTGTAYKLRWAFFTVATVLALAYVMNLSGQTITVGTWIAGTGALFAFLSPILGWLGTAVTGSDTSANALFATLQQTAAQQAGLDPHLMVAANTSGGVVGKMISPQNLTIAATAVGIGGRESELFRRTIGWSVVLLLALCVLIFLQSTPVLSWMVPTF